MDIASSFHFLDSCANLLNSATVTFTKYIEMPTFSPEDGGKFRFKKPAIREYAVLQCIRIVSGLRAILHLLSKGYFQEVGVIARRLVEFLHNLDFVLEGFINAESVPQIKERVRQYFSECTRTTEELMNAPKKRSAFPRKKVYVAIGRLLGGNNPHRFRQIAKALEDVYSGYVHGNYPHIMEMYNGAKLEFTTSGATQKIPEWLHYTTLIVHPILNQFSTIASAFNLDELEIMLIKKRETLEAIPLYKK